MLTETEFWLEGFISESNDFSMESRSGKPPLGAPFLSVLASIIARFYGIISLIILITYFFSMAMGMYFFFLTAEGIAFSSRNISNLPFFLFYSSQLQLTGPYSVGLIFLIISLFFLMAFAVAFLTNVRYASAFRELFISGNMKHAKSNFLLIMPAICSCTFFSFGLINQFQESVGIPVGGISFSNPFQEVILTSYAAIIEEFSFRLIPVAVPVALFLLFQASSNIAQLSLRNRFSLILLAVFKPKLFQSRLGIPTSQVLGRLKYFLIIASAAFFSYAHLASGDWQIGKLSSTFIIGLIMGYCCLQYGFDSSILIHWFFNTYWSILSLGSGINSFFALLNDFSYGITLYVGMLSLIALTIIILTKITGNNKKIFSSDQ